MSDGLDVIAPQGKAVTYRGERLEIQPLTIGQLPAVVRAAKPVIAALVSMKVAADEGETLQAFDMVVALMEDHGEQLYLAAAAAIGREAEWVAQGRLDEFLELATAVVEVNRDFFVQSLVPMLAARVRASRASGDGRTPSSSSSNAGTP